MIHKVLSRKTPSFMNLIEYMNNSAEELGFCYGLWSSPEAPEQVEAEFYTNSKYLPKRKNGNCLSHQILALPHKPDVGVAIQRKLLRDLADFYIKNYLSEQLVYGQIHTNTDYVHLHLMVSSNKLGSAKREHLKKSDLRQVQQALESRKLEIAGDLFPERIFTSASKECVSSNEYALKERTAEPSNNDRIRGDISAAISASKSIEQLQGRLSVLGFKLYQRGKTYGVIDQASSKRYRLKTLGLSDQLQGLLRLEALSQRLMNRDIERDLDGGYERD